jgi:hypothetical protein
MSSNEMPSLAGTERARIEDFNWACGLFTWAMWELEKTLRMAIAAGDNPGLWRAAEDTKDAIIEKLTEWEPSNGPN